MLNILNITITLVPARADLERGSILDMEISLPLRLHKLHDER
jgi:hypothetical protein